MITQKTSKGDQKRLAAPYTIPTNLHHIKRKIKFAYFIKNKTVHKSL